MYNYIITSDDKEAVNDKIEGIKKSIKKELDVSVYDLATDSLYNVIDELSTVSMFDEVKFVVVKSLDKINKVPENILVELLNLMNNLNIENFLVFVAVENIDFRIECYAKVRQFSTLVDIKTKNIPMDKYATQIFEGDGYKIDNDALSLLISYSPNLANLKQSIEILECYKADDKRITNLDVLKMIQKHLDDSIWKFVELVLLDDKKEIMKSYKEFKILNPNPTYIISMLIAKFQELYNCYIIARGARSKEEAQNEIQKLFGVTQGRAYYMVKNTRNTNLNTIKSNLDYLLKLDLKIKSGLINDDLGLELYFLR